ncbi:uncharacterized protein LOC110176459 isoform X2 [Drosophila serrata]|uniref:uncharacterized protein LOC110176459 isoform X2 n=1 Tax=Drosophila serrata TaxID=7274 RepID=UPI000A1D0DBC|nr:uncharacterized protein LOC110176459 isoform X2 [Drosophila serrata]
MADMEEVPGKAASRLGMRHLQAALLFVGLAANTILQLNVGVAVVAMTNDTSSTTTTTTTTSSEDGDTPVALQLDGSGEVLHPVQLLLGLCSGPVSRWISLQALWL